MSTPCCGTSQISLQYQLMSRKTGTHGIKHTAQSLQLFLDVLLLALQLGEREVGGTAVGGPGGRRSRRDGGCVKVAHSQRQAHSVAEIVAKVNTMRSLSSAPGCS